MKGWTLIEFMVAIALIAVLVAIGFSAGFECPKKKAQENEYYERVE